MRVATPVPVEEFLARAVTPMTTPCAGQSYASPLYPALEKRIAEEAGQQEQRR